MHVDLAGGAHTGSGTPCELLRRRGFRQGEELIGGVLPFSVETLPQALHVSRIRLGVRRAHEEERRKGKDGQEDAAHGINVLSVEFPGTLNLVIGRQEDLMARISCRRM